MTPRIHQGQIGVTDQLSKFSAVTSTVAMVPPG